MSDLIQAQETKAGFELRFKYNTTVIMAVKEISGSYWLPGKSVWIVPIRRREELRRVLARFNKLDFDSNMVIQAVQAEIEVEGYTVDKTMPKLSVTIPLKKELRDYQGDGVEYARIKKSCLMGDQQGLGKTITAIAAVIAENAFPCLIICKSALATNWEKEIKDWTNKPVIRFNDSCKRTWPEIFRAGFAQFGIVSFDSIKKYFVKEFLKIDPTKDVLHTKDIILKDDCSMFRSIIVDESHLCKDDSTLRTKLTTKMCLGREYRFLLSGTPVLNSPEELYPQLVMMGKAYIFGKPGEFKTLYGKGSKRQKQSLPYLNHLLHKHCYFRRLKSEVAKEIPEKTRQVILCDIDNRAEYDEANYNFEKFLRERLSRTDGQINKALQAEALVRIGYLKHLSAKGKLVHLYEWMDSLDEEEEKAVIFTFHKDIQQSIFDYKKPGTVRLCGSATPEFLAKRKMAFQEDPNIRRILCSLMADAEGHTLTAASNLAMFELPWHFGKAEQCEDRIHRISTKYPVTISYFLGQNTIDRDIYDLIMEKKDMHDMITGTEEENEQSVKDQLLNSLFYKL